MERHSLLVNLRTLEQEVPEQEVPEQHGFTQRVSENLSLHWQMHVAKFVPASAAMILVRTEICINITVGKVVWKGKSLLPAEEQVVVGYNRPSPNQSQPLLHHQNMRVSRLEARIMKGYAIGWEDTRSATCEFHVWQWK